MAESSEWAVAPDDADLAARIADAMCQVAAAPAAERSLEDP
jgi:hypothetical protein